MSKIRTLISGFASLSDSSDCRSGFDVPWKKQLSARVTLRGIQMHIKESSYSAEDCEILCPDSEIYGAVVYANEELTL